MYIYMCVCVHVPWVRGAGYICVCVYIHAPWVRGGGYVYIHTCVCVRVYMLLGCVVLVIDSRQESKAK